MDKIDVLPDVETGKLQQSSQPKGSFGSMKRMSLKRSLSSGNQSRQSARSYISNLSLINRENLTRFGRSKITFVVVNSIFTFIGLAITLFSMFTWISNFSDAPLIVIVSEAVLTGLTATAALMACTGFLGFLGAFTHRKAILALYALLTWPVLAGWITVGYIGYKNRNSVDWEYTASKNWDDFSTEKQFECCGYLSVLDRPFVDEQCAGLIDTSLEKRQRSESIRPASESIQIVQTPACHDEWLAFGQSYLLTAYSISFTLVPVTLAAFIVGILATNHIYD